MPNEIEQGQPSYNELAAAGLAPELPDPDTKQKKIFEQSVKAFGKQAKRVGKILAEEESEAEERINSRLRQEAFNQNFETLSKLDVLRGGRGTADFPAKTLKKIINLALATEDQSIIDYISNRVPRFLNIGTRQVEDSWDSWSSEIETGLQDNLKVSEPKATQIIEKIFRYIEQLK